MPRTTIIIIDDGSEDTALPVTSTITRVGSSPGTGTVTVTRTVPNIEGPVPPPPAPPYNPQTAWETGGVNGSAAPGSILPSGLVAVYAGALSNSQRPASENFADRNIFCV